MATCLCRTISHLAKDFDGAKAKDLTPELNRHLAAIRSILSKSKPFARDVHYHIAPNNQRAMKVLSIQAVDMTRVNQIFERFKNDLAGFWTPSDDSVHTELRRRLVCLVVFLRSVLDPEASIPPQIARFVPGQKHSELRYAGKKYIKIARKLGGIGSVFCLPLDIPSSTYERYVNMDDEEIFAQLNSVCPETQGYTEYVQHLIASQLNDASLPLSYHNLFVEYGDVVPDSDQLPLLLHAFGGLEVPDYIFKSIRVPQRRYNTEGEIQTTKATEFGLPSELISLFSDDHRLARARGCPSISQKVHDDGIVTLSLRPETMSMFSITLLPQAMEHFAILALRLLCFVCPPCFEGNLSWSPQVKWHIWPLLDRAIEKRKIPLLLKNHVIEALLYFSERDSFILRRIAIERARLLLRKTMPYSLHASVALFQSILYRLDGDLDKSDTRIREFLSKDKTPVTRLDNALMGRLHISQIENKIQRCEDDVASCILEWHGEHPLSSFEIEVTRRLQSTAAMFFQSTGDFQTARASLEQYLFLSPAEPIRVNTRRLIVGRLADIYCELLDYGKAAELLRPELASLTDSDKCTRPVRRLLLASIEEKIGHDRLDIAESILQDLVSFEPPSFDEMTDQSLHMRRLMAAARTAHERLDFEEALERWRFALGRMDQVPAFKSMNSFIAGIIYLSMAHAQLHLGDDEGGRQSWAIAAEIFRSEKCQYWIPVAATIWLRKIVNAVFQLKGWPFRMMLPGRKPDMTWP
ncbi:hypothetical protein B0J13DRAFT_594555 [Dactylonectria estremocensis]|uniref:Uncharacterized protein n=1 Tax=Dactylonectria estremocensis TaxID=1079267 RepID=A0A9P9F1Q0_9HYPO|nr:hypothetical protein B0J13DRAFT_594555 [Dactylonectria estremocensis]